MKTFADMSVTATVMYYEETRYTSVLKSLRAEFSFALI